MDRMNAGTKKHATKWGGALLAGCLIATTAHGQPSRFATQVVDSHHAGGQSYGELSNLLGGPRGGEFPALVWSLGTSPTTESFVTLGFNCVITDGPGPDFIVFENSFEFDGNYFGELAYVEVSTNGADFVRFPVMSTNPGPIGAFDPVDPLGTDNLAGNWPTYANVKTNPVNPNPFNPALPTTDPTAAGGTPFDLADLATHPAVLDGTLDLDNVHFVRVVDVYGDGSQLDIFNNPIYDPTGTQGVESADIDAVSVINYHENTPHEWEQFGSGAQGGGRQYFNGALRSLDSLEWEAGNGFLSTEGSVCLLPGNPPRVFTWGGNAAGDAAYVHAFRTDTGAPLWTSPALDPGFSVLFQSFSSPSASSELNAVFLGVGQSVYRFDADTGAIEWATPLNAGGSMDIVNGSCHIGGGKVFIASYGGFAPAGKRLYALDANNGSVLWSVQSGGPGSDAPVYVNDGTQEWVFNLLDLGIAAYDANTGAEIWTNNAPLGGATPWSTLLGAFGGLSYADGALFFPTYDFFAVDSQLACVHAATGELLWMAANPYNGSSTPLVIGQSVFIAGESGFGNPSFLGAFNIATGQLQWGRQLAASSTMWNISAVGTNDLIYVTEGTGGEGLHILDAATGTDMSTPTVDSQRATGTPAIGADGTVYTNSQSGTLLCFRDPIGGLPALLDIMGVAGYTSLSPDVNKVVSPSDGFLAQDEKTGNWIQIVSLVEPDENGSLSGPAVMILRNSNMTIIDQLEILAEGRIRYDERTVVEFVGDGDVKGIDAESIETRLNSKIMLKGKGVDPETGDKWAFKLKGNDQSVYSGVESKGRKPHVQGFVLDIKAKVGKLAKAKTTVVETDWQTETGRFATSPTSFHPTKDDLTRWEGDGLLSSPFYENAQGERIWLQGGAFDMKAKWATNDKGKSSDLGKISMKIENGNARGKLDGWTTTPETRAALDGFTPEDIDLITRKMTFSTPAASTRVTYKVSKHPR